MKRFILILSVLLFTVGTTDMQAQWLKKLGKTAEKAAKRAVERNVEKKVDNAVDDAFDSAEDGVKDGVKGKKKTKGQAGLKAEKNTASEEESTENGNTVQEEEPALATAEMSWNAFDFVAGDEVIFDDNQAGEQLGEFPSRWDLVEGEAEIAKLNGENVVCMRNGCKLRPLMKDIYSYFGEVFTIEFDYYFTLEKEGEDHGNFNLSLIPSDKNWAGYSICEIGLPGNINYWYWDRRKQGGNTGKVDYRYRWKTTANESRDGNRQQLITPNRWVHISISFNQRAMKIYVDQIRIGNIPNMVNTIGWMQLNYGSAQEGINGYIRNVRIAKGAVPLYDRMMTDGKFITYGITFDVGKSVIKPESMGEINRIVKLMADNPELKFSVEGHTDSTGSASSNQTLSEARSKAIVDKLTELGIKADRLSSAGKGQNNPIADNGTDEGRAKNRRVEFVKI